MSLRLTLRTPWAEAHRGRATTPQLLSLTRLTDQLSRSFSSSNVNHDRQGLRRRRIFSLVQPTGIPHLGNYLGAIRTWKDFQDEKTATGSEKRNHLLIYGLADLHSLTLPQDPQERSENVRKTFASLLAVGLDPDQCTLFVQSQVPAHTELMWILSNVASTGYLSRMTQWKEKMGLANPQSSTRSLSNLDDKSQEKLKLSLFSYPVLQAADILLHSPDTVPVGEDQAQHVEFTRQLARSFNATYAPNGQPPILKVPDLLLSPAKRVMSLQDPTKKMSKSDPDPLSRILITDDADDIKLKFKKAKTDSLAGPITYSPIDRPGVSNLIDIYKHVKRSSQSQEKVAEELQDMTLGALKSLVAETVILELGDIRNKYLELMDDNNPTLDNAMVKGRALAITRSTPLMLEVRKAIGMYPVDDRRYKRSQSSRGKVKDGVGEE